MAKELTWSQESNLLLLKLAEEHKKENGRPDFDIVQRRFPARTARGCQDQHWRLTRKAAKSGDLGAIDPPNHQQLFEAIKDNPKTLAQLADVFDRAPKVIRRKLNEMEEARYNLVIFKDYFAVQTSTKPQAKAPEVSIADLMGKEFNILVASDWQVGSKWAQPTALNKCIQYAYEEYDVRHTFVPGDIHDGAYVYRGQLDNLIPQSRPLSRKRVWMATEAQVQLADIYAPKLPNHQYYMMGGNHDYSLLSISGQDPIRILTDRRDDMVYGGYDLWGIPLTEKAYIRLVHPTGGVAYARSYKLQKGIESLAFEALKEAMREEMPPIVSILVMAHYHLTNHTPEHPLHGILAGCFQGQTDYLKRKNLTPHIAGVILQMKVSPDGRICEFAHRPIPFDEIKHDWKGWPVPEIADPDLDAEEVGTLFSFTGEEPQEEEAEKPEA